jgi:asparagine synthetase B (glutamine-hydrolysing)
MPSKIGNEPLAGYPYREEARSLGETISKACETTVSGHETVAVAFSGGLDSALLALLCARYTDVRLYVAGKPGCHDFLAAESAAEALPLPLTKIEIERLQDRIRLDPLALAPDASGEYQSVQFVAV